MPSGFGARRGRVVVVALLFACGGPPPPEPPLPADTVAVPTPTPTPAPPAVPAPEPEVVPGRPGAVEATVRIGLLVGAASVRITGGGDLLLTAANGAQRSLPALDAVTLRPGARGVTGSGLPASAVLTVSPLAPDGMVSVDGRPYRGSVRIRPDGPGLSVVNVVGLESYLAGVLPLELGRLEEGDLQAMKAQAIVSRTYALRNLGKRERDGFDLLGTVADQVYGGASVETDLAWRALRETAGRIVTWRGAPIDAFFFSTCGGRTAEGTEVYAGADRPYLRSVADVDAAGEAWCRLSPRFRWTVRWTRAELQAVLRQTVPAVTGRRLAAADRVRGVRVTSHTPSGRVATMTLDLGGRTLPVRGPAIRQVLRPAPGEILRSAAFDLREDRGGGSLHALTADGRGAGHGVGFCQWGAIGRARAGFRYDQILAAYYPGTELTQVY